MRICFFRSSRPAADPLSSSNRLVNGMQARPANDADVNHGERARIRSDSLVCNLILATNAIDNKQSRGTSGV